jgi:hypothetical protein
MTAIEVRLETKQRRSRLIGPDIELIDGRLLIAQMGQEVDGVAGPVAIFAVAVADWLRTSQCAQVQIADTALL